MSKPNPVDRKYTKEHEWAKGNGDGTIIMGITDHAQELLTDIVFVELPAIGKKIKQMERLRWWNLLNQFPTCMHR
jgi:glycine cleavage system H protein